VMVDGSDIYGDGVNIAARLQEFAEPGDVVVSGSVYDQVHNKLSIGFDCLGQQQMKNLVTPVTSYRVTMSGRAGGRRSFPARESFTPQADEVAAAQTGAPSIPDRRGLSRLMGPVSDRLVKLPRPIAAILAVAGFLVLINVFTGRRIWFHWPVASLLLVVTLLAALRRKPASQRMEERRRGRE
jgi:adenylate cyclase